jgi:hypothetical protein
MTVRSKEELDTGKTAFFFILLESWLIVETGVSGCSGLLMARAIGLWRWGFDPLSLLICSDCWYGIRGTIFWGLGSSINIFFLLLFSFDWLKGSVLSWLEPDTRSLDGFHDTERKHIHEIDEGKLIFGSFPPGKKNWKKEKKDQDIWCWKSRSWLVTDTKKWQD